MRNPLFPTILAAFMSVTAVNAEEPLSLFNSLSPSEAVPSQRLIDVAFHAVLLMDYSTSIEPAELERARNGVLTYLLSDEAVLDYNSGLSTAVTLVYFAGDQIVSPTYIVSSVEEAQKIVDSYLGRMESYEGQGNSIYLEGGHFLKDGTNVLGAIEVVPSIFDAEEAMGIYSERREVVLVGDQLFEDQIARVREFSDLITDTYGARVCPVSVHDEGTDPPEYNNLATPHTKYIFNERGHNVRVSGCPVQHATKPAEVRLAVAHALGMPRQ